MSSAMHFFLPWAGVRDPKRNKCRLAEDKTEYVPDNECMHHSQVSCRD